MTLKTNTVRVRKLRFALGVIEPISTSSREGSLMVYGKAKTWRGKGTHWGKSQDSPCREEYALRYWIKLFLGEGVQFSTPRIWFGLPGHSRVKLTIFARQRIKVTKDWPLEARAETWLSTREEAPEQPEQRVSNLSRGWATWVEGEQPERRRWLTVSEAKMRNVESLF
jgi:hypothetical protein